VEPGSPRFAPSCNASNPPDQKFCGECGSALGRGRAGGRFAAPGSYTPKHLAERILTSKAALEGERQQVTVLFADLKGSMELIADRDPEEARKLLDPVLARLMEAVHRCEGTVNQVMGDGIMALFGAPLAHEDHAVRACSAALRMQELVKTYAEELRRSDGHDVQIRVGLNSGEVVGVVATSAWTTPRWARPPTWPPAWGRFQARVDPGDGRMPPARGGLVAERPVATLGSRRSRHGRLQRLSHRRLPARPVGAARRRAP